MEKFNNTTLFTGYLKQLLHNFNLPKYRIYTKQDEYYHETAVNYNALAKLYNDNNPKEVPKQLIPEEASDVLQTITKLDTPIKTESRDDIKEIWYPSNVRYIPYIKDGKIQEYINGRWYDIGLKPTIKAPHIHYYTEGMKILNYTKTLKITTNSYDSYTHEYLGDYLRFQRDYNNVNLMPLYNCFSDRQCDSLKLEWGPKDNKIVFDTTDSNYKIYMVPVKLFKEYTIAIDSETPIELCCGLYGAYQDTKDKFKSIPQQTYQRVQYSYFLQPVLYSKLLKFNTAENKNLLVELAQNEEMLKLFIKVPQSNKSTIVILEGNYLGWNDSIANNMAKKRTNKTVINFEHINKDILFDLKTPLQLLRFNTGEQHPFADKLMEYLLGNTITSTDEITKNIARVQKVIKNATARSKITIDSKGNMVKPYNYKIEELGYWDDNLKYILYDYMRTNMSSFEVDHDILGYVDKDTEKYYHYYPKDGSTESISISNFELDEEE